MGFMNLPNEPPIVLQEDGSTYIAPIEGMTAGTGTYPLFTRVSLETISFCNRSCTFCPLHWSQDERGRVFMKPELYTKIVDELGRLNFAGVVQMFLLSEPTIDHTMLDKLKQLREACPNVSTYASTNGDVFYTLAKTRGLPAAVAKAMSYFEAGLNSLNINIYDEGEEGHRHYEVYRDIVIQLMALGVKRTVHKYARHPPKGAFVEITDMRPEGIRSRTTDVFFIKSKAEREHVKALDLHCARPHRHITIEYDGYVPICCAIDATDRTLPKMGDVNTQSLVEIWNCPAMNKYRWFLQQKRRVLVGCNNCTHRMSFPHIVRKVQPSDQLAYDWEGSVTEPDYGEPA